jgi:hypothetical protein
MSEELPEVQSKYPAVLLRGSLLKLFPLKVKPMSMPCKKQRSGMIGTER